MTKTPEPKHTPTALETSHAALVAALERAERFLERCESNGGSTDGQNTSLPDEIAALALAREEVSRG